MALLIGFFAAAAGTAALLGIDGNGNRGPDASKLPVPLLAGERIVAGFNGPAIPGDLARMIRRGQIAGVILFSDNVRGRDGVRRLIRSLQRIRRPRGVRYPLLVMADQEGGLVKRVSGAPTASGAEMGRRGGEFSRRQGRLTARNLRDLGINVDLAPVLDVGRPGSAMREELRSFGGTAERVEGTAVPFARALEGGGISATAKHFPGIGAAGTNTDIAVQRIGLSRRKLRQVDERPFARFIAAGGDLVMLSSAIYPAFSDKPAAFAREIATRELRGRLDFEGVSITDSLQSTSAQAVGGPEEVGLAAAKAGADLLLFSDFRVATEARRALVRKLRAGAIDRRRFVRSVQRVLELRAGLQR